MLRTVVIIRATFLTSQRCTAVSIDTRNAVARFRGQFWNGTCIVESPTLQHGYDFIHRHEYDTITVANRYIVCLMGWTGLRTFPDAGACSNMPATHAQTTSPP